MACKVLKKSVLFWGVTLLVFLQISCSTKRNKKQIDDEIILTAGQVEITRYEFEKNKSREFDPQRSSYQQWLNNYLDETYLLAEAYAMRCDSLPEIQKTVHYATLTMIGEVGGYLWNKVEEPKLNLSRSQVKKVYKKRNRVFHLEYLLFPDGKTMSESLGNNTIINNNSDFDAAVNRCKKDSSVRYSKIALLYPFSSLYPLKDFIISLKEGEISKPLKTYNGIYIIRASKIEACDLKPFRTEYKKFLGELQQYLRMQLIKGKQAEIFSQANIWINPSTVNEIWLLLQEDQQLQENYDENNDTVLLYSLQNKRIALKLNGFTDYFSHLPFRQVIKNQQMLHQIFENYVIEQYLYIEAEKQGILKDKEFILDRKNFRNKVMINYYINNIVRSKIHITEQDALDYYQNNRQKYSEPQSCIFSVIKFKDYTTAYLKYNSIAQMLKAGSTDILSDTDLKNSVVSYDSSTVLHRSTKDYPSDIIKTIFNLPVDQVSLPFNFDNTGLLFVKRSESDKRISPFVEVKEMIVNSLADEELKKQLIRTTEILKTKYPAKGNLIDQDKILDVNN